MKTYVVHPMADLFPMMPEDELQELAEDIKENGLLHPIVLGADDLLIDGRNRLKACALAGVEPTFTSLNGHDPIAYILSANVNRRNITEGQRAMAIASAYPDAKRGRGNKDEALKDDEESSFRRLVQRARFVRRHAGVRADAVMFGTLALTTAYAATVKERDATDSEKSDLEMLGREAPDLAVMVSEQTCTLDEALAKLRERKRERQHDIEIMSDRLSKVIKGALDPLASADHRAHAIDLFSDEHSFLDQPLTRDVISQAARNLAALAKEWTR